MENYLKESPQDFNYESPNLQVEQRKELDNTSKNEFSLNLEQPYQSNFEDELDNQFPTIPGLEFLSPNLNEEGFSGSFDNESFLGELDSFSYPAQGQPVSSPFNNSNITPQNLDEIISPNNNTDIQFLDSQYFSPSGKQSLDINSLSPQISATRGIPFQNTTNFNLSSGSYLSPHQNLLSPSSTNFENSLDTLKSPNFGSYLNSPPQYNNARSVSNHISSSIPDNYSSTNGMINNPKFNEQSLIPNTNGLSNINSLGTSAPSNNLDSHPSSKQLSKEEKLKRRREFHNAVERRRRDLIKEKIKELGLLVPPSLLNPQLVAVQTFQKASQLNNEGISELLSSVKVKESKPNKSTILNKTVDYINHLKYVMDQQHKTSKMLQEKLNSLTASSSYDVPSAFNDTNLNTTTNFMDDFHNQQISEETFNPDEFFSEIITSNDVS